MSWSVGCSARSRVVHEEHARWVMQADAWRGKRLSEIQARHSYGRAGLELGMDKVGAADKSKKRTREGDDSMAGISVSRQRV